MGSSRPIDTSVAKGDKFSLKMPWKKFNGYKVALT